MSQPKFRAIRIEAANQPARLVSIDSSALGEGDLLVRVTHSSLNYKDGLAVLGRPGVVRSFPSTCGIDLAGTVVEASSAFAEGDAVLLTGAGLSETRPGGYSELQRIDSSHAIATPEALGSWGAMAIGTAGLTAMLCVLRLEAAGLVPSAGPVLVTGATGGVGSFAVATLARLGYEVHAVTGSTAEHEYLRSLGAQQIFDREELAGEPQALGKERWAGGIDSVGGATLVNLLTQVRYSGAVAACGLAGGPLLPATVLPFILRNISLLGVDSVHASPELRRAAWNRLANVFTVQDLQSIATDATLENVPELSERILRGEIRGRIVVSVSPA